MKSYHVFIMLVNHAGTYKGSPTDFSSKTGDRSKAQKAQKARKSRDRLVSHLKTPISRHDLVSYNFGPLNRFEKFFDSSSIDIWVVKAQREEQKGAWKSQILISNFESTG